eukprot:SAG25_NODE_205_length_11932_cov_40.485760_15_plen_97_part_00
MVTPVPGPPDEAEHLVHLRRRDMRWLWGFSSAAALAAASTIHTKHELVRVGRSSRARSQKHELVLRLYSRGDPITEYFFIRTAVNSTAGTEISVSE